MASEISWIAAVAFVALTGIAGLTGAASTASYRPTRHRLIMLGGVVLPAALLAGLLWTS